MSTEPPPQLPQSRPLRWVSILIVMAGMGFSTGRLISSGPLKSANDRSRWCTVWSLAERGTYQIDEARVKPGWDTIDLVKHEGHFYSTKPPVLPWMVSQLYRGLRGVTGWTLDSHLLNVTRTLLFLVNILPMTIALLLWRAMLARRLTDPFAQLVVLTFLTSGTMLTPFLSVFNNHTIGAASLMFGIWALEQIDRHPLARWPWIVCGMSLSFLVCNELPAASLAGLVFLGLWAKDPRRTWGLFVTAAIVPIGMFFWTNYDATGGWRPFYSYYGTEKYRFIHEGVPSYWMDPKGIDRNLDSFPVYLLHCTIGHHGWFSLTPLLVWTLLVWAVPAWRRAISWPLRLSEITAFVSLLVLAFYLQKTENYNYGGVSVALRWMIWLSPLWALMMGPALAALGRYWLGRIAVMITLLISIGSAWVPYDGPWRQSWIFDVMTRAHWIDYSDPKPVLPRKVSSWIYTLPDSPGVDSTYWVEFTTQTASGPETLLLRDAGPGPSATSITRRIEVVWETRTPRSRSLWIEIARDPFLAGKPLVECLVAPTAEPERQTALDFLAGLPQPAPYWSSAIKYLRTALQRDALRTHVAYAYIPWKNPDGTVQHLTRNVWFSEQIPFGVVQFESQTRKNLQSPPSSSQKFGVSRIGRWLPSPDPLPPR